MALERYRPSGRFRPTLAVYLPAAVAVAAALGGLYQWMLSRIPFVYLNFAITLAFGAALGLIAAAVVGRAEVRSPLISYGLGVVIALFAVLASHAWNLMSAASEVVARHPELGVPEVMLSGWRPWLADRVTGGWTIKRIAVTGPAVVAIWAGETLLVGAMAIAVLRRRAAWPYCEGCLRWLVSQSARIEGRDASSAAPLLSAADLTGVVSLVRGDRTGDAPHLVFSRWYCLGCQEHEYLSISELTFTRNRKNELDTHQRVIASLLLMPQQAREKFTERFGSTRPS